MTDNFKCCIVTGFCIGGLVGLGLGIWASVVYLEPEFEKTDGFNEKGAKALTAAVDLFGGLEATAGAGALGGVIVFGVAACFLACCSQLCSQRQSASDREAPKNHTLFQLESPAPLIQDAPCEVFFRT